MPEKIWTPLKDDRYHCGWCGWNGTEIGEQCADFGERLRYCCYQCGQEVFPKKDEKDA